MEQATLAWLQERVSGERLEGKSEKEIQKKRDSVVAFIRNPSVSLGSLPPSAESEQSTKRREIEKEANRHRGIEPKRKGERKELKRGGRVRELR